MARTGASSGLKRGVNEVEWADGFGRECPLHLGVEYVQGLEQGV